MLAEKLQEAAGNGLASTLYVDDVFSTWLYTGNGSTQTITNGIDLAGKGGMVWIKARNDSGSSHTLTDTNRGAYNRIRSNSDGSNFNQSPYGLTAFGATGFTVADDSIGGNGVNGPPGGTYSGNGTYASWTFRKAAKFFDVVTYTGTGSARTIAHSLGVAPGMVIVKRTDTTGDWQVYSNGLTSAAYSIQLNLTAAQASAPTVWNSTAPTSSVFSVGTDATVNASGGTYVAYLYAHDTSSTGIIQCGSFMTDASGNATVNLGWEPQYFMYRGVNTSATSWVVADSMRKLIAEGTSISDAALFPNDSAAEATGYDCVGVTATGIKTYGLLASKTYIYMAIRRPNKPPTSGTQVYNAVTYTGNGAARTISGVGFTVDATIVDARSSAYSSIGTIGDRLRGNLNSETPSNSTEAARGISGFATMDGFSLTAALQVNANPYSFISWNFKRAPGFFDEVCYTGTGSATTQAHNLTVAPELMFVKSRSTNNAWRVYSNAQGNTNYLVLNSTAATATDSTTWNNTTPTTSVFSIGSDIATNQSSITFVAYLFATLAGISKVGSYTGNGTTQTINCGFTGGARFVLIKRTDSTGDWYVFDTARGMTTLTDPYLLLNSTAAEVATLGAVTSVTTGFAVNAAIVAAINTNAASYIFLAIA